MLPPRLTGLGLVLLCVQLLSGCVSSPTEAVAVPYRPAEGWSVGYHAQGLTEMVRRGETVENWTELLTIQAQVEEKEGGLIPLREMLGNYKEIQVAAHPGSTVTLIREEPDRVIFEAHIRANANAQDERLIACFLDGQTSRFAVTYAVRSPVNMTPELRAEWIKRLGMAKIVTEERGALDSFLNLFLGN